MTKGWLFSMEPDSDEDERLAADYGYSDGSGVHRVGQRLEEKAKEDRALARRLKVLAEEVSCVKS